MELKNSDGLGSVPVEERSGAGLPYAPVDWPNPGDVWTWKLGKRIRAGFCQDRRIFLPRRLHQKGKRRSFESKKSLQGYLQSEFPGTNVDAFFQSFTWKVPVIFNPSCEKAQVTPRPKKVHLWSKSEKIRETKVRRKSWRLVMAKASSKKRIRFSPKEVKDVIDLSSWSNGTGSCKSKADNSKVATDSKNIQASAIQNTGSQSSRDGTRHSCKKNSPEWIPNDSDMLIDSAHSSLSQSLPKSSYVGPVNDQSVTSQENEKILEVADKFHEDLETNIAWESKLENEYNESKGREYLLRKELDYFSLYIGKIDEQISALQSKRAELASVVDVKKKLVDMLISKQKIAAGCLSKVVDEVEMGKKMQK